MSEAERYLKVSRKTIGRLVGEGRIAAAKVGRAYRFLKSELDRFLASRRRGDVVSEELRDQARAFWERLREGLYESDSRADDHDSIYDR